MQGPVQTIPQAFSNLKRQGFIRQRDAAERLQLSEGELIAAHVNKPAFLGAFACADTSDLDLESDQLKSGSDKVFMACELVALRLRPEWHEIFSALEPVGEVMALTRNASCVHEKIGVYQSAIVTDQVGVVAAGNIDLRAFYKKWMLRNV
jgi:putative hemin transport protein